MLAHLDRTPTGLQALMAFLVACSLLHHRGGLPCYR